MAIDPRNVKPGEFCRLLNSTPLGPVLTDNQFRRQRSQAGYCLGTGSAIDLVRYTAWLIGCRHAPKDSTPDADFTIRHDAARGAAAVGVGETGSRKDEALIAALLVSPTSVAAAEMVGVSVSTVYRRLQDPHFCQAYDRARRESFNAAIGRAQASAGDAVEALATIARKGRREGDRVRAAVALLEHAWKGLSQPDLLREVQAVTDQTPAGTAEVVRVLVTQLRQLALSPLPLAEKVRLGTTLCDSLLRAIGVDDIQKRLVAVEGVLGKRKGKS